jgi:hypothetical protein
MDQRRCVGDTRRIIPALPRQRDRHAAQSHQHLDAPRHLRSHEPAGRGSKTLVRHRRARRPRRHRRPQRRARQTAKIRRPLRLGIPIHRPSLRHLRPRRGPDHRGELRQHPDPPLLRIRRRWHSPQRRSGGGWCAPQLTLRLRINVDQRQHFFAGGELSCNNPFIRAVPGNRVYRRG